MSQQYPPPQPQDRQPQAPYPQLPYPQPPPTQTIAPKSNGLATASLVLGLVGLVISWFTFAIPSVLAVIFGHTAGGQIKRLNQEGRGLAKAGLILGYVVIVPSILVAMLIFGLLGQTANEAAKLSGEPALEVSSTPDPGPTSEPVVTPTDEYTPESTPPPAVEEPVDTTTIGKTLTYKAGLSVTVVSAKVFNPGDYAVGLAAGHKAVKVVVTLHNKTGAAFDLSGAEIRLTYGADGTSAESIYTEGVGGQYPFEGNLSNGKRKTASSAFSVPKAGLSQISVEVEPDFNSETAFFTGKAR